MLNEEAVEHLMGDSEQTVLIKVFVADDDGPVYEELPALQKGPSTYELLSSPGLALNLAKGDLVSIIDPNTPAQVLKRGGNFCIQIYADHIPDKDITSLERDVNALLGGTLDGVHEGNLALSVPARNGMDRLEEVFDGFTERTGIQWYYANIYKNFEDEDDETLLNWWLDS